MCTCLCIHADSGLSMCEYALFLCSQSLSWLALMENFIKLIHSWTRNKPAHVPVNLSLKQKECCNASNLFTCQTHFVCYNILNINAGHWKRPWKYLWFWLGVLPLSNISSIEKWKSIQNISTLLLYATPRKIHDFFFS